MTTKQITAITLGYSTGTVMSFSMSQGSVILGCVYTKNNGLQVYYLEKDSNLPKVNRSFVFYSPWSQTPGLDNKQRYWHVGTAIQKFEPQVTTNGSYTSTYTPDDITYFVFEVE